MIDIYNSITEKVVSIDAPMFDTNNDEHFETLSDWCDDNLQDNGFYELEIYSPGLDEDDEDNRFLIQIDDDNEDWLDNFKIVVEKVNLFLKTL